MSNDKMQCQTPVAKVLPAYLDAAKALREGQFVPFFQPLVTLRTGQLAGFEVLARWQHPLRGLVPPDIFIGVAEQDGWIGELTRQILHKAFTVAVTLPEPLTLAINISPLQLRDNSLPVQIRSLASEAGFPLSRIVIEITESALIETPQSAAAIVGELKKMGCGLALDDFGTGYSSLSHLQALPFDKLKVDRSFVGAMTGKRESRKIVSAVVGLGQSLGLTTVAEGIETQEQAEMMLWLGCDLGQGYFYGRPLPADELPACLSSKREKLAINQGSAWRKISAANLDSSPTQRLAQLQAVYDGAPVGLAFIDQNLRYVNLNQRLAKMNGARIEDHLGSPVAEMIPELFPFVEPYLRRALGGEVLTDVEAQLSNTGETRLVSYHPVSDEAGEIVGVSLAVTDITERKRAEEALKQSETHYRSMVHLNPEVLWIMDPQGRNLDVNPPLDRNEPFELRSTEHEWLRSVHPSDIRPTIHAVAESRRNGSRIDVQYRVDEGGGNFRWKRSRGAPRFDAVGNIVCWYGSVEDIDAPSQQWKPFSRVGLSVEVETGIHIDDPAEKGRRNQAVCQLEIPDMLPEAEFDDLVALAAGICGTQFGLISLIESKRQWFKAPFGLAVAETHLIFSFCAQVMAQQGLLVVADAKKDERFKDHPLVLGAPHICFYASMPLLAGDGVPIGMLCVIDTVPRSLSPGQSQALAIVSHLVQARLELRSEKKRRHDGIMMRRELTTRLEISNEMLEESNQKHQQLLAELEDTRLRHESELRKRSELDTLKNEHVAMVSHELRSPLASVRGAVGLLSAGLIGPVSEKGAKLFHIALTNLDRMNRLVSDVLNLERIASGSSSLQTKRCSVEDLVNEAIDSMRPVAGERNVKLAAPTVTQRGVSALYFDVDADKTLQVLINLLSNAIKFSPPGAEVVVYVDSSSDKLTLRISDEGRGIPEDQLGRIFERFRQVEQDDARRLGGTGLGLAICRAIVEQHGGHIWAERNAVKGTSFFLTLPHSQRNLLNDGTVAIRPPSPEGRVA